MARLSVPTDATGRRLDAWLAQDVPGLSRARWQGLIRGGHVRVDGQVHKPGHVLRGRELIEYDIPPSEPVSLTAEDIPLSILYEDHDLIAINKPAGLVVHPAPGHAKGTLVHALLHHCDDLTGVGGQLRPGIVHRLDKDTSGVMIAAKNQQAHTGLTSQFKRREVEKEYLALVRGHPHPPEGVIEAAIGRSERNRKRMSTRTTRGRPATTHYAVSDALADAALVRIRIETGRTHQIRVHMAHIGHPILGDAVYGGRRVPDALKAERQMLHAYRLRIRHPATDQALEFVAPLPADIDAMTDALRRPSG